MFEPELENSFFIDGLLGDSGKVAAEEFRETKQTCTKLYARVGDTC